MLTEAEGLHKHLMPAYNAILYAWAIAASVALVRDTPNRKRLLALPAAASVFASRKVVERHFDWMAQEGKRNPR